jgi:hypothetical protein
MADRNALARSEVSAESGGFVRGLRAARLDAREIEQGVDQLQEPERVAVGGIQILCAEHARGGARGVLERAQHQRQRGSKLVAHVAEERGLGPVELRERFSALDLLFIGLEVGDARGDLPGGEAQKSAIAVVEEPITVQADDQKSTMTGLAGAGYRHDGGAVRRLVPAPARDRTEPFREVLDHLHLLVVPDGERPRSAAIEVQGVRRRDVPRLDTARRDEPRALGGLVQQVKEREGDVTRGLAEGRGSAYTSLVGGARLGEIGREIA